MAENRFIWSEVLETGPPWWGDAPRVANQAIGPNSGAQTVEEITDFFDFSIRGIYQEIAIPDITKVYCFSVYIKKDQNEARFPRIQINFYSGGETDRHTLICNTKVGEVNLTSTFPEDNAGVQDAGDYWRFWVAGKSQDVANTLISCWVVPAWNSDFNDPAGDDTAQGSVFAGEAQLSETPTLIPYIKTEATAILPSAADKLSKLYGLNGVANASIIHTN